MRACFHVWIVASTGDAMFRVRRNYWSRNTANSFVRRGCPGYAAQLKGKRAVVLRCMPGLNCEGDHQ